MMSTADTLESRAARPSANADSAQPSPLRIWPAVLLVVFIWGALYANHALELSAGPRFISRLLTLLVALLVFLAWWLSRSTVRWRDRLLAVAVTIAFGIATGLVADKSVHGMGLLLNSLPIVLTVWTAWLFISRSLAIQTQRLGFCVAMALTFGYFTLVRMDGVDAVQRSQMSWRWTATNEQKSLADRSKITTVPAKSDAAAKVWTLQPGDWPEFRGPQRDGVVTGASMVADWNEHPPKPLWRKRVGPGWSGMIVVDGHVVTQEQRDKVESVVCYDAATGNELWAHDDPVRFEEALAGAGPRGTPTFADGRIYALGGKGTLNCLKPETGDVVWSHDIFKDADMMPSDFPQWGYSVSPLVVDTLVIVFAGGTEKSVIAYRADDGKLAWTAAGGKQSYSSPQLAMLDGKKHIVMHDTEGIRVLNIADGSEVWSHPSDSKMSLPMLQPHVVAPADLVVSFTPGMVRFEVGRQRSDTDIAPKWSTNKLRPDFSDFVIHKNSIYGLNDGILCCLDLETGNQVWKKSRLGHGQMLMLADQDALLVSNEKGEIILVSVNREGPKELGRFQAIDGKTWNGPVLVGNRLILRNAAEMAAYEVNVQKSPPQAPASAQPTNSL